LHTSTHQKKKNCIPFSGFKKKGLKTPTKVNLEISNHSTQCICVGVTGKRYLEHPLKKAHSEHPLEKALSENPPQENPVYESTSSFSQHSTQHSTRFPGYIFLHTFKNVYRKRGKKKKKKKKKNQPKKNKKQKKKKKNFVNIIYI